MWDLIVSVPDHCLSFYLAIRRCKNKGKKITAAEARDSTYLDKLVKLNDGYYIFRQLRNSPAYLAARKKISLQ